MDTAFLGGDVRDVAPLRSISVMVNAACNLRCPHCDLPRRYEKYPSSLSPENWAHLIENVAADIKPDTISVSAMEPLLPKIGQPKTAAILRAGRKRGCSVGVVTNGTFAQNFFDGIGRDIEIDFLDISVDGIGEADSRIRGPEHFETVDRFLRLNANASQVGKFYISFTLTHLTACANELNPFLDWVLQVSKHARLTVLLLYPNKHVAPDLFLTNDDFRRALEILVARSEEFAEIFLDIFPSSLPNLADVIASGVLPGPDEVARYPDGMLYGHIARNLYVRYENKLDLLRRIVRISPEGYALTPDSFESSDYLTEALGSIPKAGWKNVKLRILEEIMRAESRKLPRHCANRPCVELCRGENARCALINTLSREMAL